MFLELFPSRGGGGESFRLNVSICCGLVTRGPRYTLVKRATTIEFEPACSRLSDSFCF